MTKNIPAAAATPTHTAPKVTFEKAMDAASGKISALLKGGAECVTFIASALLIGYLVEKGRKLSVMRDEFGLVLKKAGLGGTQTKKYLDYGQKMAAAMFKECQYGMEVAALVAADTPDKAHNAVTSWLHRHTFGKKTEHGFSLTKANEQLNVLGIFLGFEDDPAKPETLVTPDTPEARAAAAKKAEDVKKRFAKQVNEKPELLGAVAADKMLDAVAKVTDAFPRLVEQHVARMTKPDAIKAELDAITKAYHARIKALTENLGKHTGRSRITKAKRTDKIAA